MQRRALGSSLVEAMIGITVALVAVLVIYIAVAGSDKLRRDGLATGDAQQSATFILSRLAFDLANAGNGYAMVMFALATCPASTNVVDSLRPLSIVITDSGRDDAADSVVIRYAVARNAGAPVLFAASSDAGTPLLLRAPFGFEVGDRVIVVGRNGTCAAAEVVGVNFPSPGRVEIAHAPALPPFPQSSWAVNVGATKDTQIIRYDVVGAVLRTTDLLGGDAPNPLASNVVNLKLQYGIDSDGDGTLDTWTPARIGPSGDWSAAAVLAAPPETSRRIKAVRIGLVIRGDFLDRTITDVFRWTLFDCEAADKSTCPGRLTGIIASTSAGGYRYRTYETVVPLRNVIWNGR